METRTVKCPVCGYPDAKLHEDLASRLLTCLACSTSLCDCGNCSRSGHEALDAFKKLDSMEKEVINKAKR